MAKYEIRVYDKDMRVTVLKPIYTAPDPAMKQYDEYLEKHPNAHMELVEVHHIEHAMLWTERPKPAEPTEADNWREWWQL